MPVVLLGAWGCAQLAAELLGRPGTAAVDYQIYRAVAHIGLTHGWSTIYDRGLQEQVLVPLLPRSSWPYWWQGAQPFWAPFVSPPPAAWLVMPLDALPAGPATAIWLSALSVAMVATALLITPDRWPSRLGYLAVLVVTWAPVIAVVSANVVVLVCLVLALAWRLLEGRRDILAGLVLSLASVKPQVIFAVPLLLLVTGHWRTTAAWAAGSGALALASVASLGFHGLTQWLDLARFVGGFRGEQNLSLVRLPGSGLGSAALGLAVAVAVAVVAFRLRPRGPAIPLALGTVASLLLAPYLNLEDYVLLVPAGLLLLRVSRSPVEAVLAVALILSATPASQGFFLPTAGIFAAALVALAVSRSVSSRGPAVAAPDEVRVLRTPSPDG